jgi:hypothetical protein
MSVPELAIVLGWNHAHVEGQEEEPVGGPADSDTAESTADANESADTSGATCNQKKHPISCLEKLLQVGIYFINVIVLDSVLDSVILLDYSMFLSPSCMAAHKNIFRYFAAHQIINVV